MKSYRSERQRKPTQKPAVNVVPVKMKLNKVAHIVDKNSRTIMKLLHLLKFSNSSDSNKLDSDGVIARRIEKLKARINRRLIKLANWADTPEYERMSLEAKIAAPNFSMGLRGAKPMPLFSNVQIMRAPTIPTPAALPSMTNTISNSNNVNQVATTDTNHFAKQAIIADVLPSFPGFSNMAPPIPSHPPPGPTSNVSALQQLLNIQKQYIQDAVLQQKDINASSSVTQNNEPLEAPVDSHSSEDK